MSVMFLKDRYKDLINSYDTSLHRLAIEHTRLIDIVSVINEADIEDDPLEELTSELNSIIQLIYDARQEWEGDLRVAEANHEYELKFKPNR